jgi:hypothetical protein
MSAKTLAWISSALFAVTLLVSVGGFAYLIGQQRQMMDAFHADELLMTSVELSALEAVESGDMRKAHATMIQRIFVGLTRLQPNREQLSARQRDSVDGVVRRLAAYRERNPDDFSGREAWWIERLDGWIAALPTQ